MVKAVMEKEKHKLNFVPLNEEKHLLDNQKSEYALRKEGYGVHDLQWDLPATVVFLW